MDSNHDKVIQNHLCYRYTTRQCCEAWKMHPPGVFFNRKGSLQLGAPFSFRVARTASAVWRWVILVESMRTVADSR